MPKSESHTTQGSDVAKEAFTFLWFSAPILFVIYMIVSLVWQYGFIALIVLFGGASVCMAGFAFWIYVSCLLVGCDDDEPREMVDGDLYG